MRFIQNLLNRHFDRDANVKPRVRGIYEDEPDRMPDEKEEIQNRTETDNDPHERHRSRSTQEHAETFKVSDEPKKGILRDAPEQTEPPHFLSAQRAMPRPHDRNDERSEHVEKGANSKPQPSQEVPIANKSKSLQTNDSSGKDSITHSPVVPLAVAPNMLSKVNRDSGSKDSPYSAPKSAHHLIENGRAIEQGKKPVVEAAPSGNLSPRPKEVANKIDRPLIQSPAKPAAQRVVNINIGRVEVRGSFSPVEIHTPAPKGRTDRMTLDEYLNQQKSASR